jgi:hypothetical protein
VYWLKCNKADSGCQHRVDGLEDEIVVETSADQAGNEVVLSR